MSAGRPKTSTESKMTEAELQAKEQEIKDYKAFLEGKGENKDRIAKLVNSLSAKLDRVAELNRMSVQSTQKLVALGQESKPSERVKAQFDTVLKELTDLNKQMKATNKEMKADVDEIKSTTPRMGRRGSESSS